MTRLMQNLLAGDFCGLLLPLLILIVVGQRTVHGYPRIERLSYLIGWVGLLIFVAAGLLSRPRPDGRDLLVALVCGLVFSGYLVTVCWLVLPLLAVVAQATILEPWRALLQWWRQLKLGWRRRREDRRQDRHEQRLRRQEERLRPKRERQARLERQLQDTQAQRARHDQHVRDQLRYRLQLTYDQHRTELADKLPPAQFAAYFEQFLTNQLGPDEYARRADQLQQMLLDQIGSPARRRRPKFESIEQVIAHYEQEKDRIRRILTLDEDSRETLLIVIDDAQDLAIQEFLR